MISIGLLGLAIDTGMDRVNNYLLRWHRGAGGGRTSFIPDEERGDRARLAQGKGDS